MYYREKIQISSEYYSSKYHIIDFSNIYQINWWNPHRPMIDSVHGDVHNFIESYKTLKTNNASALMHYLHLTNDIYLAFCHNILAVEFKNIQYIFNLKTMIFHSINDLPILVVYYLLIGDINVNTVFIG